MTFAPVTLRQGSPGDLQAAARLQAQAPEAAQWNPADYLEYDFRVATCGGETAAFAVARPLPGGEGELLNLVVAPEWRRRGVARLLLRDLAERYSGALFLEVRQSNSAALAFYHAVGFQEVGRRTEYYRDPPEAAVVMRLGS